MLILKSLIEETVWIIYSTWTTYGVKMFNLIFRLPSTGWKNEDRTKESIRKASNCFFLFYVMHQLTYRCFIFNFGSLLKNTSYFISHCAPRSEPPFFCMDSSPLLMEVTGQNGYSTPPRTCVWMQSSPYTTPTLVLVLLPPAPPNRQTLLPTWPKRCPHDGNDNDDATRLMGSEGGFAFVKAFSACSLSSLASCKCFQRRRKGGQHAERIDHKPYASALGLGCTQRAGERNGQQTA